ncbi:hypothetical protein K8T06_04970 [bacterium]|nr:hypothetical protein [bacterium]
MSDMSLQKIRKFRTRIAVGVIFVAIMISGLSVTAQDNDQQSSQQELDFAADIPKAPTPVPEGEQKFIYNSHGMRDPFISLLLRPSIEGKGGLAGMKISELKLQGIQIGLGKVAIVLGTDGKAYNMGLGQSLLDGKVVAIEGRKVVFEKVILDPFGREKDKQTIELYLH